jgi:hypothetical protein
MGASATSSSDPIVLIVGRGTSGICSVGCVVILAHVRRHSIL